MMLNDRRHTPAKLEAIDSHSLKKYKRDSQRVALALASAERSSPRVAGSLRMGLALTHTRTRQSKMVAGLTPHSLVSGELEECECTCE